MNKKEELELVKELEVKYKEVEAIIFNLNDNGSWYSWYHIPFDDYLQISIRTYIEKRKKELENE